MINLCELPPHHTPPSLHILIHHCFIHCHFKIPFYNLFIHEEIMNKMERLVFLPIAMGMGCTSGSSVAVFQTHHTKKSKPQQESPNDQQLPIGVEQGEDYNLSSEKMKNSSLAFLSLPKPNISSGLQRLIKSFKNLSQLFVYKDESEELEMDIQIGFPTDVKHVTHIGWDGSTTTSNPLKGWNDLKSPEIVTIPTLSLRQFELAMAAQAEAPVC